MKRNGYYLTILIAAGSAAIAMAYYWSQDRVFAEADPDLSHAGHSHGATSSETSPELDLKQLESVQCEHQILQMECDECRYELGIVKIAPDSPAASLLKTRAVELRVLARTLSVTGHIELNLDRTAEVTAIGGGRVETIHKRLGDDVRAGETLAILHSPEFGKAKADYLEAAAQWDLAQTTFQREQQLRDNKVSSVAAFQQSQNESRRAQAAFLSAERLLEGYGLTAGQIEQLRQIAPNGDFYHLSLAAPIAGTILRQDFIQGQGVVAEQTLYRIADLSRLWVMCHLPESGLEALDQRVRAGEAIGAEVRVRAFSETRFTCTLDRILDQLDDKTRSIEVRFAVSNEERKLKPGMFAQVEIRLPDPLAQRTIPASAVLTDEGQTFVFCRLKDDMWIRRSVTVGPIQDGFVPVLDGLDINEIVVIEGGLMLKSDILREKMGAGCAH